jgi:poly-beta-1,6-N-acetyl-D-glucosamine biosynthesis protein PgaD
MKKDRDKDYYIIKKRVSYLVIFRDIFITMFLWGLWSYLLYPLFALIVWKIFQINIFFYYDSVKQIEVLEKQLYSFLIYAAILISFIAVTIISWGQYNKKRFSIYRNKRKIMPKPITSEILAKTLNNKVKNIQSAKEAKYIQVYHTSKSTKTPQRFFKEFKDQDFKHVNIIFNDNWEFIRKNSQFGFTHEYQN